ncbi:MAG: MFS transporter [Thermomicrobiales bacterium]
MSRLRASRQMPFAGWRMLFISCLAVFLSGPAQTYGVSVFVDPMQDELAWSRSLISTLYSLGTLASAGAVVLAGRQLDRWGNRLIFSISAIAFGATMFLMSIASTVVVVFLGFTLLRTFGSGVLTLAARNLLPNWFHTRAGRAFSLVGLAAMLSQALIPLWNNQLVSWFGWREAWRVNAVVIWIVLVPVVVLLVRNRPADLGQLPDGRRPTAESESSKVETGATLSQALRTRTFWFLVGASAVPSLVVTGLAFNQVSILTDRGLPTALAATSFSVEALVALPTTLLAGWLVDRYAVRHVLMFGQVCLIIAMVFLLFANATAGVLVYAAFRGASSGLWMVAAEVAWPRYFGRKYLGSIRGVGFAVGVVGAALGPIPFGLSYDVLGGYTPAIAGLLVLPVAAAIAVSRARPPLIPASSPAA